MSIRILALYALIVGLSVYAWKDWFKSLCGLILLMAVIELGDMPKTMFGIQGLNLWNVLFVMVALPWVVNRRREGLKWDMPRPTSVLLLICLGVIVIGFMRAVFDRSHIGDYPLKNLISEELINTVKWVLPALLLFDGCRTRRRVVMAMTCLLIVYLFFAVQVIRNMPVSAAFGDSNAMNYRRLKLQRKTGYAATDLSVMLGGACWGALAASSLVRKKRYKVPVWGAVAIIAFGQALTGGRAGYVAWGATGLILCLIKWRRYLILAPVVVLLLPIMLPGVTDRMLQGFGQTDVAGQTTTNEVTVLAGRTLFWPYVVDKIGQSPWIGYGRLAMRRTGLQDSLLREFGHGEAVAHPHNMYLETLLDNGVIGSLPIFALWVFVVIRSAGLFGSKNRLYSAVGGLTLALMLTSLIGGLSGQHYFPQEHTLGIWAAIFLSFRLHLEEKQAEMDAAAYVHPVPPYAMRVASSREPVEPTSALPGIPG
jgi:O-antigen ligase